MKKINDKEAFAVRYKMTEINLDEEGNNATPDNDPTTPPPPKK